MGALAGGRLRLCILHYHRLLVVIVRTILCFGRPTLSFSNCSRYACPVLLRPHHCEEIWNLPCEVDLTNAPAWLPSSVAHAKHNRSKARLLQWYPFMHMNTRKETSLLHMATSKKAPSGDALASLLGAAQAHVDSLDLESAISTYNKVLKTNPDCVPALDGLGDAYLQAGMRDEAIATLKKSIATSPEGGVERFMNLGQLCDGREALSWLDRGIAALRVAESQAASKAAASAAPQSSSERQNYVEFNGVRRET